MGSPNIWNILVREKVSGILIEMLGTEAIGKSSTYLSRKTDLTYSHAVKVLQDFQKAGLINIEKRGRRNIIVLTWQGRKVAQYFSEIKQILVKSEK